MTLRPKVATSSNRADPRNWVNSSQTTLWQSTPLLFRLRLVPYFWKISFLRRWENRRVERKTFPRTRTNIKLRALVTPRASGNRTLCPKFIPQIVNIVELITQINRLFYDCTVCKTSIIFLAFFQANGGKHATSAQSESRTTGRGSPPVERDSGSVLDARFPLLACKLHAQQKNHVYSVV